MPRPASPHDALFRKFLGRPETARDFLDIHLPGHLRALCDLDTLRPEPNSFIEPALRTACSDILYSLQTARGDGYVYCLIEHQSTPDPLMGFRLMRYSIHAMQGHLDKGRKVLPLVIPLLFYHGQTRPYPHSTCWLDNFADPGMARALYGESFPLVDVTVIPDDAILKHGQIALLELVQKHIWQRDMAEVLDFLEQMAPVARLLLTEGATDEQLRTLLNYILRVGNTDDHQAFTDRLIDLLPGYKEDVMTIAEKLRMEGLERGRVEGWEKGRLEGEAAMLARQLSRRFGPLPEWARERVRRADAAQLEAWADAVLEAGSLAEVLGDAPGGH